MRNEAIGYFKNYFIVFHHLKIGANESLNIPFGSFGSKVSQSKSVIIQVGLANQEPAFMKKEFQNKL